MQRAQARVLSAVALAALTVAGAAACSVLDQKSFEDDAKLSQKITSIRLDSRDGGVEVDASAGRAAVSVHREVNYHGDKPDDTSFHVEDGVLVLAGCGKNCGVDYVVKVPAGLPVTGGTSNGQVVLSGVGKVDVHTSNGEIRVTGAAGPVRLRTSNGGVHVEGARGGGVDAQTSNGDVTIRTASPQDVRARTTSGGLSVTVPPAAYRVSADSTNGDRNVSVKDDPSGKYRLDLSTTNGNLTVKAATG